MAHRTFASLTEAELREIEDDCDAAEYEAAVEHAVRRIGYLALSDKGRQIVRSQLWLAAIRRETADRRIAERAASMRLAAE